MATKVNYPIFYKTEIKAKNYVAVFGPEDAFEIKTHGFGKSDGYEFNIYTSRAKVRKLERSTSEYTAEEFYSLVFDYMKSYMSRVKDLTIKASALSESTEQKKLK